MSVPFCAYNLHDITKGEYLNAFTKFLEKNEMSQIEEIMLSADTSLHYPVTISVLKLLNSSQKLGSLLLAHPTYLLPLFDEAIRVTQQNFLEKNDVNIAKKENVKYTGMIYKPNCHIRLTDLPMCSQVTKHSVSSIRSADVNKFISVPGTVIKTGAVKMLEYEKEYICKSCKNKFRVKADKEQMNIIEKPRQCPTNDCRSKSFK